MWEIISKMDVVIKLGLIIAVIYVAVTLRLIIYQIKYFGKLGSLRAILILTISSLAQVLFANLTPSSLAKQTAQFIEVSDTVYTLLEFIIIQFVYYSLLKTKWDRVLLKTTILLSIAVFAISFADYFQFLEHHFSELILITSLFILLISFRSYHQIIYSETTIDLRMSYLFWFTTAVFFLFSISLPLFFFRDYLTKGNHPSVDMSYINIVSVTYYIVFFALLNTASKCKVESQK